jgi:hypothetical protein
VTDLAAVIAALFIVTPCTVLGAIYAGVGIHEGAHALVAALMGIRIKSVHIAMNGGKVVVEPKGRALPARMIAIMFAGPLANLACAWITWSLAVRLLVSNNELAAYVVGVAGVLAFLGVVNLIPVRKTKSGGTDGYKIFLWAFRPSVTTAASCADPGQLARIVAATQSPLVLLAAVRQRRSIDPAGYPQFISDAERLAAIARDPATRPADAAAIAQWLALQFGFSYLHRSIALGEPVGRADVDQIVGIAETAARLKPKSKAARIGLAVARLLEDRPADALALLANFRSDAKAQHALVTRLFAVAEIYLGNRARADALLASVTQPIDQQMRDILAKLRGATELPPLRRREIVADDATPPTVPV